MSRKVAITGVGGAACVTCIKAFRAATEWRIVGLDADPLSAGLFFCDIPASVPLASAPSFIPELLRVLKEHQVNVLLPTVDEELVPLAEAVEEFKAQGILCIVSKPEVIRACLDKYSLFQRLAAARIPVGETQLVASASDVAQYPVIVKPRTGRGGQDVFLCEGIDQLAVYLKRMQGPIIQEYLPGPEYTVDVLSDLEANPLVAVPRLRIQIKGGVSWRGRIDNAPDVSALAASAAKALGIVGPSCIQIKLDAADKPKILEVNPRVGGTTSLTVHAGVNIPLLAAKLWLGEHISEKELEFKPATIVRYFGEVFLDEGGQVAWLPPGV